MVEKAQDQEFLKHYERIRKVPQELHKWIVGMDNLIEMLLVCLLARGHILTEGSVGEGKTRTLDAFARAIGGRRFIFPWEDREMELDSFKRIQFTPDRLPESLVKVVRQRPDGILEFLPGPIIAHFLLGDEFNRASERTRAPLLEAMEESRVTVDGRTYLLPRPYMVLATVNPTDVEGVYRIGVAQSDRFLVKMHTTPETEDEAFEVLTRRIEREKAQIETVVSTEEIIEAQKFVAEFIYMSPTLARDMVRVVFKMRDRFKSGGEDDKTKYGPSGKRPYLALGAASQALAFVRGQEMVTPDIVEYLTPFVLAHRVGVGYGGTRDEVLKGIADIFREVMHEGARAKTRA